MGVNPQRRDDVREAQIATRFDGNGLHASDTTATGSNLFEIDGPFKGEFGICVSGSGCRRDTYIKVAVRHGMLLKRTSCKI